MSTEFTLSKFGGVVALLSLLFLPVVGCGGESVNGVEAIQHKQIPNEVKVWIGASVIFSFLVILIWNQIIMALFSALGIFSILTCYVQMKEKYEMLELKSGAFFAVIGFIIPIIVAFINKKSEAIHILNSNKETLSAPDLIMQTNKHIPLNIFSKIDSITKFNIVRIIGFLIDFLIVIIILN